MFSDAPLPSPTSLVKRKKSKKAKNAPVQGKDEGSNPHWNYVPPKDAVLVDYDVDSGNFDWDEVKNNDDLELWLVRVPAEVKPKYLQNVQIDVPTSSSRSATVGELNRKHISFDIWSVGDDEEQPVGGEEIRGLSCLLPRKKKGGKLYKAPKPITRHLVLCGKDVEPTLDPIKNSNPYQNPPRQSYPNELLTHRFMPYGSLVGAGEVKNDDIMDIDGENEVSQVPKGESTGTSLKESKEAKNAKVKKRKVKVDSPKKLKRAKTLE